MNPTIKWTNTVAFVDHTCVGTVHQTKDGQYHAMYHRWVVQHLTPPNTPLKTQAGARARVERYARVWLVAGQPAAEFDQPQY